jgi:hypothetical protein
MEHSGEGRAIGGMRASDRDRQAVVDRLRKAVDEGRLEVLEWDERVARAYRSVTYDELAEVAADLPPDQPAQPPRPTAGVAARPATTGLGGLGGVARELPTALKVLWTIWLTAVLINVVIWALVSAAGDLKYFWPAWVAGPSGAALLGVSVGVTMIQHNRRAAAAQRRVQAARNRR